MKREADNAGTVAIRHLSDARGHAALTFPRYRARLDGSDGALVMLGADLHGAPAGLALLERYSRAKGEARLLSLSVASDLRRRGIGKGLLKAVRAEAAKAGITTLSCWHSSRLPMRAAFEATLASAGWASPTLAEVRCAARCGAMVAEVGKWPSLCRRLFHREGFSFEPWSGVAEADRPAIGRLAAQPACLPNMGPDALTMPIEPGVSIAVRLRGELVGWVLAQLEPSAAGRETTLHYASAYLDRALWRTGILVVAYFRAYERQQARFGPDSIARYSTGPHMPAMMALTRRRFAPIADWVDEFYESHLEVTPEL